MNRGVRSAGLLMSVVGLGVFGTLGSGLPLSTAAASQPSVGANSAAPGAAVVFGQFIDASGEFLQPVAPFELESGVVDVAAGHGFVLALKESGQVVAWPHDYSAVQVPEEARAGVSAIAASQDHGYAVKHGQLIAWGKDIQAPSRLTDVVDVAATRNLALARMADGSVVSWNPLEPVDSKRYWQSVPAEVKNVDSISVQRYAVALKDGVPLAWQGKYLLPVPEEFRSGVTAAIATSSGVAVIKDGQAFEWSYDYDWNVQAPNLVISGEEAWPMTNPLDRLWIAETALIGLGPSGQVETLRDRRSRYLLEENPMLWSHVQDLAVDPSSGTGIAIRSMGAPDPTPRLTMDCKPVQVGKGRKLECSGTTSGIAPGERLGVFRNVWRGGAWQFGFAGNALIYVAGVTPVVKPDGTFRFRVSDPLCMEGCWGDGGKLATRNAYQMRYYRTTKHLELRYRFEYVEWRWPSK